MVSKPDHGAFVKAACKYYLEHGKVNPAHLSRLKQLCRKGFKFFPSCVELQNISVDSGAPQQTARPTMRQIGKMTVADMLKMKNKR
jgi:hypothetical protein